MKLIWLACVACILYPAVSYCTEMEINSKVLEYEEDSKFLLAQGTVTIKWDGKSCRADEVRYWQDKEYIEANGNVSFVEKGNEIRARNMLYEINKQTGSMEVVTSSVAPWFYNSISVRKTNANEIVTNKSEFTTCNLKKPHYIIKTKKQKYGPVKKLYFTILFSIMKDYRRFICRFLAKGLENTNMIYM